MLRYGVDPIIFLINNGGYTIEVEIHDVSTGSSSSPEQHVHGMLQGSWVSCAWASPGDMAGRGGCEGVKRSHYCQRKEGLPAGLRCCCGVCRTAGAVQRDQELGLLRLRAGHAQRRGQAVDRRGRCGAAGGG